MNPTTPASNSCILTILAFFLTMAPSSIDGLARINIGTAANYVILAETGITTTGTTAIVGSIAVSPEVATSMTGFGFTLSPDGTYSTSSIIAAPGKAYAADYASPTPSILTTAISDMESAYTDAAGRPSPNHLNFGSPPGALTGPLLLTPGLYKWTTGVSLGGTVTINGTATDIWIFQISGTLGFGSGAQIVLSGGALCSNVFWQVADQVTFGPGSAPWGIFLGKTGIVFNAGATLGCGRALAQTAVTLIANDIRQP